MRRHHIVIQPYRQGCAGGNRGVSVLSHLIERALVRLQVSNVASWIFAQELTKSGLFLSAIRPEYGTHVGFQVRWTLAIFTRE